ncbi:hypothetical protein ACFZBU_45785 [Embleya sp. NPDC008237]|uniref:hypothetical protein n=1 Tax=Embleya sp. NPDC008237 TaxID=3363978 RepID=UPI0036E196AC
MASRLGEEQRPLGTAGDQAGSSWVWLQGLARFVPARDSAPTPEFDEVRAARDADHEHSRPGHHTPVTRHIPVNEYVEQLIRTDNERLRERFLAGAQEVLDGYGDLLDEIEARG